MEITGSVLAAVALCVVSAVAYATGALLQQRLAQHPMRVLLRTPRWWLAIAASGAGALLHVAALRYGPLVLVQALGVLTLVFAVPLGALAAGRRVGRAELVATGTAALGLAGLMALISSTPAAALSGLQLVGVLLGTAAVLAALGGHGGLWSSAAAGTAFGVASAVTQTLTLHLASDGFAALVAPAGVLAVLAVAALNAAGFWFAQAGYRHGLAAPLAVMTLANPAAAAVIGMLLLGEGLRGGAYGVIAALACTAAVAAAVRTLAAVKAPEPRTPALAA